MNEYEQLKHLYNYIKKSINTPLKESTLREKSKSCKDIYANLQIKFSENSVDEIFIKNSKRWYIEINQIIKAKLNKLQTKNQLALTSISMAHPVEDRPFDVKQATALVQPYDGSSSNLESFIDSVIFLKDLTKDNHMATAVKFVKTRLSGKARSGLPDTIVTIDALIDHIKLKCQDTATPDSIVAQLNILKQRGPITSFCEEIENLCGKLENVYVSHKVPADVAKTMTTKAGVNALIKGINASEIKLILKAGNFTSIKDALQKAQECTSDTSTSQVFNINNKQHHGRQDIRSNFRGNGFNRNQHYRNPSRGGFTRFAPRFQPNYYHHSSRGRYQRGGYNNRGRFNDNRPRFDNTNRIYMANVDQPSGPPQAQNREISNRAANQQQQNQQQNQRNFLDQC